jgi:hypothetical protein
MFEKVIKIQLTEARKTSTDLVCTLTRQAKVKVHTSMNGASKRGVDKYLERRRDILSHSPLPKPAEPLYSPPPHGFLI